MKQIVMSFMILFVILTSTANAATNEEIAEINEITREPWTVFTIYLGMPTQQFVDNFSRLNNWSNTSYKYKLTSRGKPAHTIKYERNHHSMSIKEEVAVQSLVNGGIICTTISLSGDYSLCKRLTEIAYQNIQRKINITPKIWQNSGDMVFCSQWNDRYNDREVSIKLYNMGAPYGLSYGLVVIERYKMEAVI